MRITFLGEQAKPGYSTFGGCRIALKIKKMPRRSLGAAKVPHDAKQDIGQESYRQKQDRHIHLGSEEIPGRLMLKQAVVADENLA